MKNFEPRNPDYIEYTKLMISRNKFISHLGFNINKIDPGYLEGVLPFQEIHQQQNGWLHGGVTSAILDMIQGFASYSLVEDGQKVFTVEAKTSYLNSGQADCFYSRGRVIKPGKRFHFCEGEVFYLKGNEEIIVAKGTATMAVI